MQDEQSQVEIDGDDQSGSQDEMEPRTVARKLCQELKGPTPKGFLQMRVELTELQSQLRLREMQRQVEKDKATALLAKQRKQLCVLEAEKSTLLNTLKSMRRKSRIKRDRSPRSIQEQKMISKITELLQRLNELEKLCSNEREKIQVINEKIKIVDDNILEENKMWAKSKTSLDFSNEEKMLNVFENRRQHATVLYNKLLSSNAVIREQIDQILKDREQYSSIYRNLEKTLAGKMKETKALITKATTAYEQRDAILLKLKETRDELEQSEISHRNQVRMLRRQKEREIHLDRFLRDKTKPRSASATLSKDYQQTRSFLRSDSFPEFPANRKLSARTMASYREVFQRLQQVFYSNEHGLEDTGRETNDEKSRIKLSGNLECGPQSEPANFDLLVDNFIQEEERSFGLFAFVGQASEAAERLQQQIDTARSKLADLEQDETTRAQRNRDRLQILQGHLESTRVESDLLRLKTSECDRCLSLAVTGIGQLIKLAHFDSDQIGPIKAQMDDSNVLANLSRLEERVARIALILDALGDIVEPTQLTPSSTQDDVTPNDQEELTVSNSPNEDDNDSKLIEDVKL